MWSRVDPVWSPTCAMFSHCLRMERETEALVLGLWVVLRNIPPEGACIKPLEQTKDWRWIERPQAWQLNGSSVSQHLCPHCIAQFNSHSHMFIAFASGDGERVGREWGEGTSRRGKTDPVMEMRRPNGCLRNWKQMISAAAKKRSRENKADCMGKQAIVNAVAQFQACTDIEERTPHPPFLSSSLLKRTLFMAFCMVARPPVPHGGCGLLLHHCPQKSLA